MATQHSGQPTRPSDDEIRRTIQCVICKATYAPSPLHEYLLRTPPIALESAFMSICHFCFRCRRPACPDCWDDVHGVCGECSLEADLPFRTAPAPLSGALFAPSRQEQAARVHPVPTPLVCLHPGRFQRSPSSLVRPSTASVNPASMAVQAPGKQRQELRVAENHVPTPYVSPRTDISERETRPERKRDISEQETQPGRKRATEISRQVEYALTIVSFTLLLIILVLIGLAVYSADANTLIAHILHVDIRAEIAYLLQLIKHLHLH